MTYDIRIHGRRYAPTYPPVDNSDHLPMTCLALEGLGAAPARIATFVEAYLPRLAPLPADAPLRARQDELREELARDGIPTVLDRHLPGLISGWYRDAYHPLIRLGYGVEFDVAEEVAAGLAYLQRCGASPVVERLAGAVGRADDSVRPLADAAGWRVSTPRGARFNEQAEAVLGDPRCSGLAPLVADNLRQASRAALAAFASTHDFFALHLVTGSHAFRIVHAHAGPDADAVLNLGLLAGYVAIGAPTLQALPEPPADASGPTRAHLLEVCGDDEHDLKLAYSAWAQARHWQDDTYLTVADAYLRRHRSAPDRVID